MASVELYPATAALALLLGGHGYRKGSLSWSGAVAASLLGYLCLGALLLSWRMRSGLRSLSKPATPLRRIDARPLLCRIESYEGALAAPLDAFDARYSTEHPQRASSKTVTTVMARAVNAMLSRSLAMRGSASSAQPFGVTPTLTPPPPLAAAYMQSTIRRSSPRCNSSAPVSPSLPPA